MSEVVFPYTVRISNGHRPTHDSCMQRIRSFARSASCDSNTVRTSLLFKLARDDPKMLVDTGECSLSTHVPLTSRLTVASVPQRRMGCAVLLPVRCGLSLNPARMHQFMRRAAGAAPAFNPSSACPLAIKPPATRRCTSSCALASIARFIAGLPLARSPQMQPPAVPVLTLAYV